MESEVLSLHARGLPVHRIMSRAETTEQETRDILRKNGLTPHPDDSRLTESQLAAELEKWSAWIWSRVHQWARAYPEIEEGDIHSEAIVGCLIAGEKFDPRTGHKFATYADPWIRQRLQRYVCRMGMRGFGGTTESHGKKLAWVRVASVDQLGDSTDRPSWEPEDPLTPDRARELSRGDSWWKEQLAGLDNRSRHLVYLHYHDGLTYDQIAFQTMKTYGLSKVRVRQIITQALEKMRESGVEAD